jgi:hypothetical protein
MEIRGMVGEMPIKVVVLENEWVDILGIDSGDELARLPLDRRVHIEGDVLSIGSLSIVVDRSFMKDAAALVTIASRIPPPPPRTPSRTLLKVCSKCGAEVMATSRYCSSCGLPLTVEEVQEQSDFRGAQSEGPPGIGDDELWAKPPAIGEGSSGSGSTSSVGRRNLLLVGLAAAIAVVVIVASRDGGSSDAVSANVSTSSACETLSRYANIGIPATYIDDGAQLLNRLADEFISLGREDIASEIDEIVNLTYEGPTGQIYAKNRLLSASSNYC